MIEDGTYRGVLDRFEVGPDDTLLAVIVLEADGETVGDVVVPAERLSEDARHADAVLDVAVEDGEFAGASYQAGETERRGSEAQSRFDRLSRRPEGDQKDGDDGAGDGDTDG